MSRDVSIAKDARWLASRDLQTLLSVLGEGDDEARVVGGAIRNTLFGEPVGDIDIATTTEPDETISRVLTAGFKAVPTGYEHGTVTALTGSRAYEITSLRADVSTDGRRAKVRFGRDWKSDAERRDFTINALYADADGVIYDPVGGLSDIQTRTLRFIGDPETRISEDYLRILRFFRFFAYYGSGRPESEGLKACARLKDGLDRLSVERVWAELKKLLSAEDCSRAILWMRQTGVLSKVLPESAKWGIDAIPGLVAAERKLGWKPDPLLRLEAMVRPNPAAMALLADRLRLSRREMLRLLNWSEVPVQDLLGDDTAKVLYNVGRAPSVDALRLLLASRLASAGPGGEGSPEVAAVKDRLTFAEAWEKPEFPIRGRDIVPLGVKKGPGMGDILHRLESDWINSGFSLTRELLLEKASQMTVPAGPQSE